MIWVNVEALAVEYLAIEIEMTPKTSLMGAGIDPEFRDDVARIIEASEKAAATWTVTCTDFYPPPVVFGAAAILRNVAGITAIPWGGYPQACH